MYLCLHKHANVSRCLLISSGKRGFVSSASCTDFHHLQAHALCLSVKYILHINAHIWYWCPVFVCMWVWWACMRVCVRVCVSILLLRLILMSDGQRLSLKATENMNTVAPSFISLPCHFTVFLLLIHPSLPQYYTLTLTHFFNCCLWTFSQGLALPDHFQNPFLSHWRGKRKQWCDAVLLNRKRQNLPFWMSSMYP